MTIEELNLLVNDYLSKNAYDNLFALVEDKTSLIKDSNELSLLYYLCEINKEGYEKEGKLGILQGKKSLGEVVEAYSLFKKYIQRISYCPEYGVSELPVVMKKTGAGVRDLLWTIQAATLNAEETLAKVRGEQNVFGGQKKNYIPRHDYKDVKLDFIICSNDSLELDEALFYIGRLNVPDGVTIDVLSIADAVSMCAGYNEGMQASTAKYKVYMHHDVRIIEQDFIPKVIDLFMDHEEVGLLGMIGTKGFPSDGTMWHANRFGSVIDTHVHETLELRKYERKEPQEGLLCDGLLLATQYDLPWREDLFDGWDFYDASQCMEFHRAGYKVMIPYQETSWCVHDCGFSNLKKYDRYREIFLKEYEEDAGELIEVYEPEAQGGYYENIRTDLVEMINSREQDEIHVLEIGCGTGETLGYIKKMYPNSHVCGIEYVASVAEKAKPELSVICGDVENMEIPFEEESFDYIVCGDVIEHLRDPEVTIEKLKRFLKPNGCIIASIPNLMQAEVIYDLLRGYFSYRDSGILDRTHLRFFTEKEIQKMFLRLGFSIEEMNRRIVKGHTTQELKDFYDKLLSIDGLAAREQFDTFQYLVRAKVL